MQSSKRIALLLAFLMSAGSHSASGQPIVTEVSINGSVSLSIKTEGEVTALLLLLSPSGQHQVKVHTNCSSSEEREEIITPLKRNVTEIQEKASVTKAKSAKVTVDDIIALRLVGENVSANENQSTTTEETLESALPLAKNCLDLQEQGEVESGVYVIHPYDCCSNRSISVYCDQETDEGGWTVIQRRDLYPQQEDFFRGWQSYVDGFGDLTQEFWLGLNNIHALTNQSDYEIRFDMKDFEGVRRWAKFSYFYVGPADSDFRMNVNGYSGTANDSFTRHNNMPFATKDHESSNRCASTYKGAWWYNICHDSNLNGQYLRGHQESYADGINWRSWRGYYYSLKSTEMKIRPKK